MNNRSRFAAQKQSRNDTAVGVRALSSYSFYIFYFFFSNYNRTVSILKRIIVEAVDSSEITYSMIFSVVLFVMDQRFFTVKTKIISFIFHLGYRNLIMGFRLKWFSIKKNCPIRTTTKDKEQSWRVNLILIMCSFKN